MSSVGGKNSQRRKQRRIDIENLVGNTCAKCAKQFPFVCLDLHHVDPTEKDTGVSQMLTHSWDNIVKEIEKCVVLCACCHRLEHQELRETADV